MLAVLSIPLSIMLIVLAILSLLIIILIVVDDTDHFQILNAVVVGGLIDLLMIIFEIFIKA